METYYSIGEIVEEFGFPVHYHDEWEILIVWNGHGRFNMFRQDAEGWFNPDVFHTSEEVADVSTARKIAKNYMELLEKENEENG